VSSDAATATLRRIACGVGTQPAAATAAQLVLLLALLWIGNLMIKN